MTVNDASLFPTPFPLAKESRQKRDNSISPAFRDSAEHRRAQHTASHTHTHTKQKSPPIQHPLSYSTLTAPATATATASTSQRQRQTKRFASTIFFSTRLVSSRLNCWSRLSSPTTPSRVSAGDSPSSPFDTIGGCARSHSPPIIHPSARAHRRVFDVIHLPPRPTTVPIAAIDLDIAS